MADLALPKANSLPAQFSMPQLGMRWEEANRQNTEAVAAVRKATADKDAALAPIEAKMTREMGNSPAAPKLAAIPDKFEHKGMSNEQMSDAMSTMFAFAAIGGAMTRQPMTAAMNAFASGLKGLAQGDELLFKRESAEFDRNMKAAIAKNQQAVQEYQMAMEKHKGDLQSMMTEWRLISAKHNDTVGAAQIQANNAQGMMKHVENLVQQGARMDQQAKQFELQMKRLDQQIAHQNAMMVETRRYHDFQIKNAQEKNALKEKAAAQGGKPTATERQHYIDANQLLKSIDRIEGMLKDPETRAKIEEARVGNYLSDAVENKAIQQFLVRPNLDPKVKSYLTEVANLRNQYYLDMSGKAVTGGEALRNFGAVVQPSDTADDVLNKMNIARTRTTERMSDMATYFPSLASINPGRRAADASAPGVEFNGFRFPDQASLDAYKKAAGIP